MSFLQPVLLFLAVLGCVQGSGLTCDSPGVVCIGVPADCAAHNVASCDVLAKLNFTNGMVHVELSAVPNGPKPLVLTNRWIGVGFSHDGHMGDSPVVHCFEQNGKAVTKLTYNSDQGDFNEGWTGIDQSQLNAKQLLANGNSLSCSLDLKPNVHIKSSNWDLSRQPCFLIAATGTMRNGAIAVHDMEPQSSSKKYSFHA